MGKPELLDFSKARIRILHLSWFALFTCFFIWFNMAPLASIMVKNLEWLTPAHIKILAICNVALTIPARIVVGALTDRFGPRAVFSGLLIFIALPIFMFAFGTSFMQLMIARLFISSIGAGFVIGVRLVADWFPAKMVGRAEGFYSGMGNFGAAWAAITLPWIVLYWWGAYESSWRYALAFNGFISMVVGLMFFLNIKDTPRGKAFKGITQVQPLTVTSRADLLHLILWSFPLVGALGLLAWRLGSVNISDNPADKFLSNEALYVIYGILALFFVIHIYKTLKVNLPILKAGVPQRERYSFKTVAALNTAYFANFGAELAVISMLPLFFETTFKVGPQLAGIVASSFAFVNLLARPIAGLFSDSLVSRKNALMLFMLGVSVSFVGMAFINGAWPIWLAVLMIVVCSLFVQGAEVATFTIIPFIKPSMTGQISGMASAYGNVGAVVYLVLYSVVDTREFFLILSGGAVLSIVICLLFLKEPVNVFEEDTLATKPVLTNPNSFVNNAFGSANNP
jgi:MFS transporter, NNP family, nitrate/nitrite transporter